VDVTAWRARRADAPDCEVGHAGRAVVGNLGFLVHVATDSVADQRTDNREPGRFDVFLDRVRHVTETPDLVHNAYLQLLVETVHEWEIARVA